MPRKLGDVDKVACRKNRSDKGKERKLYRGKEIKRKRRIKFEKKIGDKTHLKLWIWDYVPVSVSGRNRWNKYTRAYMCPFVCPADRRLRIDVLVTDINTKEKIEQMVATNMWAGTFYIMGLTNAKTKSHTKWVKICKIVVKETEHGNVARMTNNYRLFRYWFWEK